MMGRAQRVKPDAVLMRRPQGVTASCHRLATLRRKMLRALVETRQLSRGCVARPRKSWRRTGPRFAPL